MEAKKSLVFSLPVTLVIILIEGFVTIAVEMLVIRQLITVVGNSVIITSVIIGVFLLFLALGYYKGGRYKANYGEVLKNNFTVAAILLGVGLSYLFIQIFFYYSFVWLTSNTLLALAIYLLVVIAPLVYFLGQTVPITTNLFRAGHHIGSVSGKVLCISTLGSFLGSICTTLVLMNFFGVAWTVYVNYLLLVCLFLFISNPKEDWLRLVALIILSIIILLINVGMEKKIFIRTNNYGDYQILKNIYYQPTQVGTLLNINNSPSSFISTEKKGFAYIEIIKQILFQDLQFTKKDILVLGAGGFSLSAESTFGNRFTYVDIDGELPDIVKKGLISKIKGEFIHDDARKFLQFTTRKFCAVVSDVYSNHYTIPFHLLSAEYFQAVKKVLLPGGVAIFNIIANPTLQDNYSRRVDNTIRSVFQNCMSIPHPYTNGPANIVYICAAKSNTDQTIYTDNLNRSMLDIHRGANE